MDQEDEAKEIFILSLLSDRWVLGRFLFTQNDFKFLMHLERKMSQFEIIAKRLIRSKKALHFDLLTKLRTLGDKSQIFRQQKQL